MALGRLLVSWAERSAVRWFASSAGDRGEPDFSAKLAHALLR